MRCSACGFSVPTKMTEKHGNACPSCGHTLDIDPVELLSNPALGFVTEIRPGQIELTKTLAQMFRTPGRQVGLFEGGCGVGKAAPLTAKILCPDGWQTMADMKVGTPVVGRDGAVYEVTGVFPQGKREVFRVTFTDSAQTLCCDEHLWLVQSKEDHAKRRPGRVRPLKDLMAQGLKTGWDHNHWIPIIQPADFAGDVLLLDPYLMGVQLSDKHATKPIPKAYKWTTVRNRLALLQGLLDTDGVMDGNLLKYVTSSALLALGVQQLVWSLGGTVAISSYAHERCAGQRRYHLCPRLPSDMAPFRLPRKAALYALRREGSPRRAIHDIQSVGMMETQCIAVSAPDQLYITDDFIVTHNTFSYGITSALTKKRVVIATGKKALQDQLGNKDLRYIQRQLGVPASFVALKGKRNYLCARELARKKKIFVKRDKLALWDQLTAWLEDNPTGDLDTLPLVLGSPENSCTANDCDCDVEDMRCGHKRVKAAAKEADMVVVNHSLLGYDLRFGAGSVFGPYTHLIIDEAHTAADSIRDAFSETLSSHWMRKAYNKLDRAKAGLLPHRRRQEARWERLFDDLPESKLLPVGFFGAKLTSALAALRQLEDDLKSLICDRWHPSSKSAQKVTPIGDMLRTVHISNTDGALLESVNEAALLALFRKLSSNLQAKERMVLATVTGDPNWIYCRETATDGTVVIVHKPVNLAPLVRPSLNQIEKLVFTSATLDFKVIKSDFGVTSNYEMSVPSPFPYAKSLVYIPKHLPRPNDKAWHGAAAKEIVQLIRASKGNALVLFSSMLDLTTIQDLITTNYVLKHKIFAQCKGVRPLDVFQQFLATDNSVLFGSKTFFEGVDIKGSKLRLVIIAKIPFPPKDSPLNEAKKALLGRNVFWNQHYYPKMFNDIKQAAGRLLRTASDRGVVAILDVRIWVAGNPDLDPRTVGTQQVPWHGYGHNIIHALPFSCFSPKFLHVHQYFENLLR